MEESETLCFHCKHPIEEHFVNPITNLITCIRITRIADSKCYYCNCTYLNANKEVDHGKS